MRPFTIEIPEEQIDDLKRRLRYSRLPGGIFQVDSQDGISLPFMRRLMDYWREGFDWRARKRVLIICPISWQKFRAIPFTSFTQWGLAQPPFHLF